MKYDAITFKDFLAVHTAISDNPELDPDGIIDKMVMDRRRSSGSEGGPVGEALDKAARRKRGIMMKKLSKKIQKAKAKNLLKKAPTEVLMKRAEKQARENMKKKLAKGRTDLSPGEKEAIEAKVDKKKGAIKKGAKKLLPILKKKEAERVAAMHKDESVTEAKNEPTLPKTLDGPKFNYTVWQVKNSGDTNKEHLDNWNEVEAWADKYKNKYATIKIKRSDGKIQVLDHDGENFVPVK